ncbi:MAG: glucose-6-phosphate dehydrogenase, partial [Paracoccaceae bacterium]|nr:glucose-6-phosphate dehydrogenase [Paracoccaceae bacterium]
MVSRIIPVAPFDLVIFGGTGDLARRKILPGLFRRFCAGQMPDGAQIIGAARAEQGLASYREAIENAIVEFADPSAEDRTQIEEFLQHVSFISIDAKGTRGWAALKEMLRADKVRAFYFSVAPALFGQLAEQLHGNGLLGAHSRVVVEKPFGRDLDSAKALNAALAVHFNEDQVYRIDHYLGKETVQNLMAVRFGNMLFEPLWNSQYVDHIQITVAETVGVGGRGGYYDSSGAMRDMVQ